MKTMKTMKTMNTAVTCYVLNNDVERAYLTCCCCCCCCCRFDYIGDKFAGALVVYLLTFIDSI
jgi:hypothetical protein